MIWFLFKLWITVDLLIVLVWVLVAYFQEASETQDVDEFLEDYYRR